MKKNGYTIIELLIVIAIFGIGYFVMANSVSYAFNVDVDKNLYESKINLITNTAKMYAEAHPELFEESTTLYWTVAELGEKVVELNDAEGEVLDPRNSEKNLNSLKLKVVYKDEKAEASILEA